MKNFFRTILPSCRDVSRLQSNALDSPLPLSKRFGMRLHLLVCRWCRCYGRQINFLRGAVQARPDKLAESDPQSLPNDARERLKKSLHDASE